MDEAQALQQLQAILARPEFQSDPAQPWWQPVFGPLLALASDLWAQLAQTALDAAAGRAGDLGIAILIGCGIATVGVVWFLVRTVRTTLAANPQLRQTTAVVRRQRSDELWEAAQRLLAAGDLSQAVRSLYLSALYALDERALLQVESTLTNVEHARRLSQTQPRLGARFAELVQRYDRLRYGGAPLTPEGVVELRALVAAARAQDAA